MITRTQAMWKNHYINCPVETLLPGLILAAFAGIVTADTSAPIDDLGYSQYQGSWNATSNVTSFLGIRYAAPPTGTLRFAAPQTPASTAGVQQATNPPNFCYQAPTGQNSVNPFTAVESSVVKRDFTPTNSEDCLFLSVYAPGTNFDTSLPVVVWIHGGGYTSGEGYWYHGDSLVDNAHGGVVSVVIQYRLGLLGFLPGNAVKAGGVLNAGLLDQNFALQWVQQHIHKFGGDPTKVTIWGESAGAGSVLQHVVAHGGHTNPPLFRGAITSSTFLPSQYYYNATIPEALYSEVVSQANCSTASDSLSCLRSANLTDLQTINYNINYEGFDGTFVFVPVIDGEFIVESPTVTLLKGKHNAETLYSVTNSNEGYIFVNQEDSNVTQYIAELFPGLNNKQVQQGAAVYSSVPNTTVAQQCDLVMTESIFVCPTYSLLHAFGKSAHKGEFAIPPALHGFDVPYYFQIDPPYGNTIEFNNTAFITAFSESFASAIMFQNPGVKFDKTNPAPAWAPWSESHTEMLFNKTETNKPVIQTIQTDPALLQRCAFWWNVYQATGQ